MQEWQKEWLGIKPADFVIYAGFLCIVFMYYSTSIILDIILAITGFILCLISIYWGSKPHPELNKINNFIKVIAYPLCTLLFLYLVYLNFTAW